MNKLHDALHAMPWWLLAIFIILLLIASGADENSWPRGTNGSELQSAKPWQTRVIDNTFSWLAFAALIFFTIAYYWPADS